MPLFSPIPNRVLSFGGSPEDHALFAWSMDAAIVSTSAALSAAGTLQGARIYIPRAGVITNIHCHVVAAGATLTANSCAAAIYDGATGALKGTTGDQSTAWASIGSKTMALGSSFAATPGFYDIAVWYNGTTAPSLSRQAAISSVNIGLTGSSIRFFTANTGVTTAAPATLGTKTAQTIAWFFAVS